MMLKDSRIPLYQQLADTLRKNISAGVYKSGDLMPGEHYLAAEYKISVGTVRNAINGLVKDGILERFPGKGTFVCKPKSAFSFVDCFCYNMKDDEESIVEFEIIEREMKVVSPIVASSLEMEYNSNVISIHRIKRIEKNPIFFEKIWLPAEVFTPLMDLPITDLTVPSLHSLYNSACDQLIGTFEEALSPQIANSKTANLLSVNDGSLVMLVERLTRDQNRKPIEHREVLGRTDFFHYRVEDMQQHTVVG